MSHHSAARVSVRKLTLADFRNYGALSLDLEPGAVVLTGENGAGKTNLLEALSLLAPGRGMRRAAYAEVARDGGASGFAIHARLDGPDGEAEIGTGTAGLEPGEGGRRVRVNGANRPADDLLEWLQVLWLTPSMDALFTGPAGDRRRFLDRLVLTVAARHGQRALDYEKAMRGRNRLLAEGSRDGRWFEAIEAQMAETGVAIAAARAETVRLLAAMTARLPETGPFPQADLAIAGALEERVGREAAIDTEADFRRALA
ncbi:MAG: AAA family ATPase, partial [Rhizobiaceae bacterium]